MFSPGTTSADWGVMTGARSISVGGSVSDSVIVTGDDNVVTWSRTELPQAVAVDIQAELTALKVALASIAGTDRALIEAAVAEAQHLAKKPEPPKDKVAAALERAVAYAGGAEKVAASGEKIRPALKAIGGWLGEFGPSVLKLAGIALV